MGDIFSVGLFCVCSRMSHGWYREFEQILGKGVAVKRSLHWARDPLITWVAFLPFLVDNLIINKSEVFIYEQSSPLLRRKIACQ